MIRIATIAFVVGAAALGLAYAVGATDAPSLTRSALAAWLVIVSLPLGALPVLMALDLAGRGAMRGGGALRVLAAGFLPLALVGAVALLLGLVAPGLFDVTTLYGWSTGGMHGLAARWFVPKWFAIRGLVYLALWTALALVFAREAPMPSTMRRRLAALGLGLHLVVGTLAALDWTMSLEPGMNASAFGLVLLTLQSAFALGAALLMTLWSDRGPPPRDLVLLMLVAVAVAAFMQFTQYLVVWSANLPRDAAWYRHRFAGLGTALSLAAPAVVAVAAVLLTPIGWSRRRGRVAVGACLLVFVGAAELLWLVTPAWRGAFTLSGLDGLAVVGLGGIVGAGAFLVDGLARRSTRNG